VTPSPKQTTAKQTTAEPATAEPTAAAVQPAIENEFAQLSYEQARDALADVVRRLEGGAETLEESLALWERGEALARHCEQWLAGAQARLDAATAPADFES
jgi:exodeoxyribonuclease VII small subunit